MADLLAYLTNINITYNNAYKQARKNKRAVKPRIRLAPRGNEASHL